MSVTWTLGSIVAGRLMIATSYRLTAMVGALAGRGRLVLIALEPPRRAWASTGALLVGVGMGFCNTTFIVAVQASVGWGERGVATSSTMFMRIVGQALGAASFGAILNLSVQRCAPDAGAAINRLMAPAARQSLGANEIARLTEAVGSSLHVVYVIAGLVVRHQLAPGPGPTGEGSARPARVGALDLAPMPRRLS